MFWLSLVIACVSAYSVWHVTDIHLDPYYDVKGNPLDLCHVSPRQNYATGECGRFGYAQAFTPRLLLDSGLDFVRSHLEPDDLSAH